MKRVLIGLQDRVNRPGYIRNEFAEHARTTLGLLFEDTEFIVNITTKPGYFAFSGDFPGTELDRIRAAVERMTPRLTEVDYAEGIPTTMDSQSGAGDVPPPDTVRS